MRKKMRFMLAGSAVVVAAATPAIAIADDGSAAASASRACERQFDEAQRVDMESFRDYDLETWRAGHDDDAITVFASGVWFQGRDRIAQVLHRHFEDREAIFTWTELSRDVDGCKTGTILYDSGYEIPSIGFKQRTYTSVIYTYKHGKWLSVLDQGTLVSSP